MNTRKAMELELVSVFVAAALLGVEVCTVRAWLARRVLPKVLCGRAVRIPRAAIIEFIEKNTIPALHERQNSRGSSAA